MLDYITNAEIADEIATFGIEDEFVPDEPDCEAIKREKQLAWLRKLPNEGCTLYAVVEHTNIDYGIDGGIVGLYESYELAAKVVETLADVYVSNNEFEPNRYEVVPLQCGASPVDRFGVKRQMSWAYIE